MSNYKPLIITNPTRGIKEDVIRLRGIPGQKNIYKVSGTSSDQAQGVGQPGGVIEVQQERGREIRKGNSELYCGRKRHLDSTRCWWSKCLKWLRVVCGIVGLVIIGTLFVNEKEAKATTSTLWNVNDTTEYGSFSLKSNPSSVEYAFEMVTSTDVSISAVKFYLRNDHSWNGSGYSSPSPEDKVSVSLVTRAYGTEIDYEFGQEIPIGYVLASQLSYSAWTAVTLYPSISLPIFPRSASGSEYYIKFVPTIATTTAGFIIKTADDTEATLYSMYRSSNVWYYWNNYGSYKRSPIATVYGSSPTGLVLDQFGGFIKTSGTEGYWKFCNVNLEIGWWKPLVDIIIWSVCPSPSIWLEVDSARDELGEQPPFSYLRTYIDSMANITATNTDHLIIRPVMPATIYAPTTTVTMDLTQGYLDSFDSDTRSIARGWIEKLIWVFMLVYFFAFTIKVIKYL